MSYKCWKKSRLTVTTELGAVAPIFWAASDLRPWHRWGKGMLLPWNFFIQTIRILLGNNKQQTFSPTFFIIMEQRKLGSSENPAIQVFPQLSDQKNSEAAELFFKLQDREILISRDFLFLSSKESRLLCQDESRNGVGSGCEYIIILTLSSHQSLFDFSTFFLG